jgi:hypothetical protein
MIAYLILQSKAGKNGRAALYLGTRKVMLFPLRPGMIHPSIDALLLHVEDHTKQARCLPVTVEQFDDIHVYL